MLQLPPGDSQRVVGEGEQPEAVVAQPSQGRGDLGMGRHGGEPVGELGGVAAGSLNIRAKTGFSESRSSKVSLTSKTMIGRSDIEGDLSYHGRVRDS